jgi:mono/diheme cytochrome c family protein
MRRASWLLAALLPFAAAAQDAERGRLLYQTHCGGCHYERMHDERLRPAVRDLADLREMVAQWAPQTKRSFTLDELADVVEYLNRSHYRFGLSPLQRKPTTRKP